MQTFVLILISLLMGPLVANAQPRDELFVSSRGNNQVLHYDGETGSFKRVFAQGKEGGLGSPNGLVFGDDGNLYVSSRGSDEVLRYNGATGEFIDTFVPAGSGGLDSPTFFVFQSFPVIMQTAMKRMPAYG